jgi:hypothetical protein
MKRHKLEISIPPSLDCNIDNGFARTAANAANTKEIEVYQVDSDDKVRIGAAAVAPARGIVSFNLATSAQLTDQVFFIAPHALKIEKIDCVYATANGAAFTATIKKVADGDALTSGVAMHTADEFDLNSTTNTVQTATLSVVPGVTNLAYKERLGIDFTGTITSVAGLVVTITYSPGNKGEIARYCMNLNGDLADQSFFVATRPLKIAKILYVSSVKSTSACNFQVQKCAGTTAPDSGTDLLTNNTNAGFDCNAVANTVQVGTLSATAANLRLAMTDRLATDFDTTKTGLAGVVCVVLFEPTYDRKEVTYTLYKNANLVDQAFFIADRDYEVRGAYCSWGTAFAGSTNIQLTIDTAADAPGAGTDLLSMDTNAGWQADGTANTPEAATFKAACGTPSPVLLAGDRLSLDFSGTTTGVDVVATVALKPV